MREVPHFLPILTGSDAESPAAQALRLLSFAKGHPGATLAQAQAELGLGADQAADGAALLERLRLARLEGGAEGAPGLSRITPAP